MSKRPIIGKHEQLTPPSGDPDTHRTTRTLVTYGVEVRVIVGPWHVEPPPPWKASRIITMPAPPAVGMGIKGIAAFGIVFIHTCFYDHDESLYVAYSDFQSDTPRDALGNGWEWDA